MQTNNVQMCRLRFLQNTRQITAAPYICFPCAARLLCCIMYVTARPVRRYHISVSRTFSLATSLKPGSTNSEACLTTSARSILSMGCRIGGAGASVSIMSIGVSSTRMQVPVHNRHSLPTKPRHHSLWRSQLCSTPPSYTPAPAHQELQTPEALLLARSRLPKSLRAGSRAHS